MDKPAIEAGKRLETIDPSPVPTTLGANQANATTTSLSAKTESDVLCKLPVMEKVEDAFQRVTPTMPKSQLVDKKNDQGLGAFVSRDPSPINQGNLIGSNSQSSYAPPGPYRGHMIAESHHLGSMPPNGSYSPWNPMMHGNGYGSFSNNMVPPHLAWNSAMSGVATNDPHRMPWNPMMGTTPFGVYPQPGMAHSQFVPRNTGGQGHPYYYAPSNLSPSMAPQNSTKNSATKPLNMTKEKPSVPSKTPPSEYSGKVQSKNMPSQTTAEEVGKATTNEATGSEPPPTANESGDAPRRSGRKTSSTVIYVDGHAVKKDNNYVMKGMTYQYGVATGVEQPPKKAHVPKPRVPSTVPKPPTAPQPLSEAEIKRRKMKEDVANRVAKKQPHRMHFLKENVDDLKPFLEPKVLEQIQAAESLDIAETETTYLQPDGIKADMRDYQLRGLSFMSSMYAKNLGFILGDEMGLGKTLQTISLIVHLKEQFGVRGPSLVVCPLSVLYSWCDEVKKWSNLKVYRLHLSNTEKIDLPDMSDFDVVVTTYEMVKAPSLQRLWSRQHFNLCVLDEGHRIKSVETQQSQAVRKVHCETRVILTGTPLANNLVELYALLNFLLPDVFTTVDPFASAYDLSNNIVDQSMLEKAKKVLNLFMIRRLKTLVEKKMPKKVEIKVICPLSNSQIWWYKALLLKDLSLLTGDGTKSSGSINNLIMQLRKCVNHPYLFPLALLAEKDRSDSLEELIGGSGKLAVLDMLLCSLYKKGHRVCLFSQFTSFLDVLDDYCKMRGWNYCRFDGGTSRAERNFVIQQFNAPDSNKFLILMSTRSGGMGLNLQTADTCILVDSDWNPQADLQAQARVHRLGQTKTVFVYRLVTANTVEERIAERCQKKMVMAAKVMNEDGSNSQALDGNESEDAGQMMDALKYGCSAVFGSKAQQNMVLPSAADIELLTDRSRTEDFTGGHNIQKGGADADVFDQTKDFTPTTDFGGIDFKKLRDEYKKKRKPKDLGAICDMYVKRQRKNRITMVEGKGSGYGSKAVPVLNSNNYSLEEGETSVFNRELGNNGGNYKNEGRKHLQAGVDFENQDMCQVCGDGGTLICCPRCPVALHPECAGCTEKTFMCCTHHNCSQCGKSNSDAGGFLYVCQCCPNAFCEDHFPKGARMLDRCERMEALGFKIKHGIYIHCSSMCENVAVKELGWVEPEKQTKAPCPPPIDLSKFFGGEVDDCLDTPEELIINTKRRRKQNTYYGNFETATTPSSKPVSTSKIDQAPTLASTSPSSGASVASGLSASRSFDSEYSDASVEVLSTSQKPQVDGLKVAQRKPESSVPRIQDFFRTPKPKSYVIVDQGNDEYFTVVPVAKGSLGVNIGSLGKATVFLGFRPLADGSKSEAERLRIFRNRYDRIIRINGQCVRDMSFDDVLKVIVAAKEKGEPNIKLHMHEYPAWHIGNNTSI